MAGGTAPVNHRDEVCGDELYHKGLGFSRCLAAFLQSSCLYQSYGYWSAHPSAGGARLISSRSFSRCRSWSAPSLETYLRDPGGN